MGGNITLNRCSVFLGFFDNELDAAAAYDIAARIAYGNYYSRPNLPYTKEVPVKNIEVVELLKKLDLINS